MKKEENKKTKLSLEEKRMLEIRKEINNDELLDEYNLIYLGMILSHAYSLKINFDNLKELNNG